MVGRRLVMIAANVAQAFDSTARTFAVNAACSSALVALHEAVLHLRAGLIDAAVVDGVYLNLDCVHLVCFSPRRPCRQAIGAGRSMRAATASCSARGPGRSCSKAGSRGPRRRPHPGCDPRHRPEQ